MRYNVAFEGGGGKGAAYLVAAAYLQQPEVRAQLNGFSGSSAGALTALALTIGIPYEKLAVFTQYGGFNRTLPVGSEETRRRQETGAVIRGVIEFGGAGQMQCGIIELPDEYKRFFDKKRMMYKVPEVAANMADDLIAGMLITNPVLPLQLLGDYVLKKQPVEKLKNALLNVTGSMKKYLNADSFANLLTTGGMFTGNMLVDALRDGLLAYAKSENMSTTTLAKWARLYDDAEYMLELSIASNKIGVNNAYPVASEDTNPYNKAARKALSAHPLSPPGQNDSPELLKVRFRDSYTDPLTFEELYEFTGRKLDLVVTGSNLLDGKTYYFSRHTTPTFPVLEAVAISMHIPVVWTPVFVSYQYKGIDYTGFYVDGGLYNNFPIRIFNDPNTAVGDMHLFRKDLKQPDQTSIGFVLDPRGDYLAPTFPSGLTVPSAAGMTVLDKSTFDQFDNQQEKGFVCVLSSKGLSMMEFAPPPTVIRDSMNTNNEKVYTFLKKFLPARRIGFFE